MTAFQLYKIAFWSPLGLLRIGPTKAIPLIWCAVRHLLGIKYSWTDSRGFIVDDKWSLICYWSTFVDRDLNHPTWMNHLASVESPVVVDVGCNTGAFTHAVLSINDSAHVIAIDPQPECYTRVAEYADRTGADITVYECACGEVEQTIPLYRNCGRDGCATLHAERLAGYAETKPVSMVRLDRLMPDGSISLLKVDCQYHDLEVIKSAGNRITDVDMVLVEAHGDGEVDPIRSHLFWAGFRCEAMVDHMDYLFVNNRTNNEH